MKRILPKTLNAEQIGKLLEAPDNDRETHEVWYKLIFEINGKKYGTSEVREELLTRSSSKKK